MQVLSFPVGEEWPLDAGYPPGVRDIHEIRLQNLGFLIQECEAQLGKPRGAVARLSTLSGVKPSLLSMLANGRIHSESGRRRQIGDDTARKLELGMGKDPNWLDIDRSQARDYKEAALLDQLRKLTPGQREAVERLMTEFIGKAPPAPPDSPA